MPSGDLGHSLLTELEEYLADWPPHKEHGKRAAIATVFALREHGTMSTGDLQRTVCETGDLAEQYSDARTLWNSVSGYFDDLPGIAKAGYGEWRYTGDEVIREGIRIG